MAQSYDELVKWPDGRTVRYAIAVDITEQKEIQANMIKTHTKLAIQSKKLQEANKKLEYMATKDFLTGINNRGNFFALAKAFWEEKSETHIFIVMLDLDKFKNINDTYGHNAGDLVLKTFTKTVEKSLDKSDIFGRLGGEEFALIISSEDKDYVFDKLEMIRQQIEQLSMIYHDKEIVITVSMGVTEKVNNDISIDLLLDEADILLYKAKNTGRNKINFRV